LEFLLQNADLHAALVSRAEAFRHELTRLNLTKYNIGGEPWERPSQAIGKRVILVPGQVESDASLSWGAPDVRTNMELLRRVRESNPDAWLIYKPHPDVVAGMRKIGVHESDALRWCDESLVDASMGQLLDEVDEVHTMTSLAGFEALMRSRKVVCYGKPFYAGWGLTEDLSHFGDNRRTRHLDLRCLVAVVLLKYPTYVSFVTRRFMTAERALLEINMQRNNENIGGLRGVFRYCLRLTLRSWSRFIQNK
jgi:capsular polysaccharide export protein